MCSLLHTRKVAEIMNRRTFFKFLGIGAATAAVAPNIFAEITPKEYSPIAIGKLEIDGLTIYEEPREGYDYSIGVETGHGLGVDPSVISVMRVGKIDEPCVQVAEYVSHEQSPVELVPIVAQIARYYGEECIDPRGPLLVIEQVSAPGDTTQHQLKRMGFTRFYQSRKEFLEKSGWYTTKFSYPMTMERFIESVRNEWYKINSIALSGDLTASGGGKYPTVWVRAATQSYVGYYTNFEDKKNA